MAKLTTAINKLDAKTLTNPGKVEKLREDISKTIDIKTTADAEEVKDLILGWKKVEQRILTPLEVAKKESYEIYKEDQTAEKDAKTKLASIKQELADKYNAFVLPKVKEEIKKHEEEHIEGTRKTAPTISINTTGLRKQPDKYELEIVAAHEIPDDYVIISYNEKAIIEHFKDTGETIKGCKIHITEGQYK